MTKEDRLRQIPSITNILSESSFSEIVKDWGEGYLKFIARHVLDEVRSRAKENESLEINKDAILKEIKEKAEQYTPSGLRAINASGILLHTGLGRAPVGARAKKYIDIASGPNLVQAERSSGGRSVREEFIEQMIRDLTGAEACTVINNNAASTFLMLRTLTKGKEVIISRSQLVEIGGSYRMPDIMEESGCKMIEVGTTNKTHLKDYEAKINENTGAILFVHQSNFSIEGFSETPSIGDLCKLGAKKNIPVLADLGSGALVDLAQWGLPSELTVQEVIKSGTLVCCFSGDKLLGGPQAGLIAGAKWAIDKIRKDKFSRMFRVCKYTLRGLEGTLLSYLNSDYKKTIPLYELLSEPLESLKARAEKIVSSLENPQLFEVIEDDAYLGGGSTPGKAVKSIAIKYRRRDKESLDDKVIHLRNMTPAIFPRIENQSIIFNLRGVFSKEDVELGSSLSNL